MKSELESKIKNIQNEINKIDALINDAQRKFENGVAISKKESTAVYNAKKNKVVLMTQLAELKHYKNKTLVLKNCAEKYANENTTTSILEFNEALENEFESYSKLLKTKLGIKSKKDILEVRDDFRKSIELLSKDLASAIQSHDAELVKTIQNQLVEQGEKLSEIDNSIDQSYISIFELLDKESKKPTKNGQKNIIALVNDIVEKRAEALNITIPQTLSEDEEINKDPMSFKDKVLNVMGIQKVDEEDDLETKKEETKKELEKKNDEEKKQSNVLKKIGVVAISTALIVGGYFFIKNIKNSEKPEKDPTPIELEYDKESLDYFVSDRGIRQSDAIELAKNSEKIDNLLDENDLDDVKTADIDEMLADIYDGHNITSSAENYDSLDTFTTLENAASVPVFNHLAGVPDYEDIDTEKSANLLEYAYYLDINEGSKFDSYMIELVNATALYYKDLNSNEAAQNLIDTIYKINKEDGFLNAQEEGIITEYILAVGGPLQVTRYDQTVTGREKVTVTHLFNDIVKDIEVFESDCVYTRTLN